LNLKDNTEIRRGSEEVQRYIDSDEDFDHKSWNPSK
jgi:hypothetical protein